MWLCLKTSSPSVLGFGLFFTQSRVVVDQIRPGKHCASSSLIGLKPDKHLNEQLSPGYIFPLKHSCGYNVPCTGAGNGEHVEALKC